MAIVWVASSALLTPKNRRRRIPHQMKPIPNAYKRYRARRIKARLCVKCSRKPKPGLLHCRVCLEKERKLRIERHPLFCLECRKLIKPEERWRGNRFHKLCGRQPSPIGRDTESWAYASNVREKCLRVVIAGNTTGWSGSGKDNIG